MKQTHALILVDLENEWRTKKSPYYLGDISILITKTNALIDYCRAKNYKIIFIRHIEKGSKTAWADKTDQTKLFKELHREKTDKVITKHTIGSFYQTNLEKELKGIKHITIAGILTNLCVRGLVSDAYDRGFSITVVKDCCVTFTKQIHEFTLKDLKNTREEIIITSLKKYKSPTARP
jgi:ureidoacrylate peracid hydrolase